MTNARIVAAACLSLVTLVACSSNGNGGAASSGSSGSSGGPPGTSTASSSGSSGAAGTGSSDASSPPPPASGVSTSLDTSRSITSLSQKELAQYAADVTTYFRANLSADEVQHAYAALEGLVAVRASTNDAARAQCSGAVATALAKRADTSAAPPSWSAPRVCSWTLAQIDACIVAEVSYTKTLATTDFCARLDVSKSPGEVVAKECSQFNCAVDGGMNTNTAGLGVGGEAIRLYPWVVADITALGLGPLY